ncbi:MAG: tetratricopeptide repeat protein [Psychrobacter sp.]
MSDRYDLPVKNIKAVFMQKSLLVIGLLFCLPSLPAQAQIQAWTQLQLCDLVASDDNLLDEIDDSAPQEGVDVQTMIEACQQAVSKHPNEQRYVYQLAQAFYNNEDYAQAYTYFRQSAEQGYAPAQHGLGKLYRMGRGVAQSDTEAVKWFLSAAKQGELYAQSDLGGMYSEGRGVAQSYEQALRWTSLAAERGDSYAQFNLGLIYEMGRGVTPSYTKAVEWYQKSAYQGNTAAQYQLQYIHR